MPATDPTAAQVTFTTRIVWAVLLAGQLVFLCVIGVLWSSAAYEPPGFDDPTVRLLFYVSCGMTLTNAMLGHVIRSQTYKSGWRGHAIAPAAYFRGNLIMLALLESAALFALVVTLMSGTFWPTILPAVVALVLQVINYPNGRAMMPAHSQFEKQATQED